MTLSHSSRRIRLFALTPVLAAAAIALTAPAGASARDTYVDRSDGSDTSAQCRRAKPCETISRANAKAGRGDTIFVGGDSVAFQTPVRLGRAKSLVHRDFSTDPAIDTSGPAVIDTALDPRPAITVASKAGTIRGLFINSQSTALEVRGSVVVTQNNFLEGGPMSGPVIDIAPDATGRAVIKDNSIHDHTPAETKVGIRNRSATAPLIAGNSMSGFSTAIETRGRTTIRNNGIWGTHTGGTSTGRGILVRGGRATISHNWLNSPDTSGNPVTGILVEADAALSRNRVIDYDVGIHLSDTPHPVEFTGDVIRTISGGGALGLAAIDNTDSPGVSNPRLTNVTIIGSGTQMSLDSVRLRLASSIIGDTQAFSMSLSGGSTCTITHSRGPVAGNSTDGCANFQTEQDPLFKADGYHLSAASPLIDKGSPEAPRRQGRDIDGDRRALDGPDGGDCKGASRRDMGADEYAC
jgi:hypothetical protein